MLRGVLDQWPSYLGYLVSFSTIGAVWLGHVVITEFLERATPLFHPSQSAAADGGFLTAIPNDALAEYVGEDRPERVAVTIYGLNLFLTAVLVSVLWRYALREGLIRPDLSDTGVKTITKKLTPGLVGYVVMILLGWNGDRAVLRR